MQTSPAFRRVPVLLLFVGSGLAALTYEVVWFQMLQLVVGSSSVSIGVLLGTFMGGMCFGSALFARLIQPGHHPLRVYAWLEAAIGLCGLALVAVIPLVGDLYTSWASSTNGGFLVRGAVAALCLLPPTLAMGATLPAMGRWVERTPHGLAWLGLFYAGNTAGAVLGTLLAGFYLLRVTDVVVTTGIAVTVNGLVAIGAWRLAATAPHVASDHGHANRPSWTETGSSRAARSVGPLVPLAIVACSGFCALAAEVVWTRYLSLLFGATTYTFSLILAVFLTGLGLGSGAGAWMATKVRRPLLTLGVLQALTVPAMLYTAVVLAEVLPARASAAQGTDIWVTFIVHIGRALVAVLPGPLLWGASFPMALAALAVAWPAERDTGRLTGRVYAANTLGAIAGALLASLVLIAVAGTQHTQQVMVAVAASAALLGLATANGVPRRVPRRAVATVVALAAVAVIWRVPAVPALLVAYGRHAAAWAGHEGDIVFVGEGLQASVAVSRGADGSLHYHNAGKIQASSLPQDMRLQRMLGHLTTLLPRDARSVLVIGCGAGVTAGAVGINPRVERVTIAEIEPLVPAVVSTHFAGVNHDVIRNPKVEVRIDDARHLLATTDARFDAITSDPLDPWVKGAAALYTKELFELVRARLNPGGVVTLFVQLYESSPETVKTEMATFFEVFPTGLVFANVFDGHALDTVLVGTVEPPVFDVDRLEARQREPAFADVRRSLGEIGIYSVVDLLGRYAGRAEDLRPWLADAPINRDRDLRLQYLAGLGVNQHRGREIYQEWLPYRRFPEDVFRASEPNLSWLRAAIEEVAE